MGSSFLSQMKNTLVPCPYCNELVREQDILEIQVCRQTHESPAEYEYFCEECLPSKYRERDTD